MRKTSLLLALLALSTFTFVGCDSNDEDDLETVLGRWEALDVPDQDDTYLNISDDEIVAHYFLAEEFGGTDCFERESLEVVSRDGNEWTLDDDGETATVTLERDGDELVATLGGNPSFTTRFEESTRTEFTPLCEE